MRQLIVFALIAFASTAGAQVPASGADPARAAQAHFKQGKAFLDEHLYDDAIQEFQAAYQLSPIAEIQFDIGQADRFKGDLPDALDAYKRYLDAVSDGQLADEARLHVAEVKRMMEDQAAARRAAAAQQAQMEQAAVRWNADRATRAHKRRRDWEMLGGSVVATLGGFGLLVGIHDTPAIIVGIPLLIGGIGGDVYFPIAATSVHGDPGPFEPIGGTAVHGLSFGWSF